MSSPSRYEGKYIGDSDKEKEGREGLGRKTERRHKGNRERDKMRQMRSMLEYAPPGLDWLIFPISANAILSSSLPSMLSVAST